MKYERTKTPVTVRKISNLAPPLSRCSMNKVLWSILEALIRKQNCQTQKQVKKLQILCDDWYKCEKSAKVADSTLADTSPGHGTIPLLPT